MTRPAEPLTLQIEDEPEVWLPVGLEFSSGEKRAVKPRDFSNWVASEWLANHAGWLARKLGMTTHPMFISTALRVGACVRLAIRDGCLYRESVTFSGAEDWLRDVDFPDAVISEGIEPGMVTFRFPEEDRPLEVRKCIELLRCNGRGVHWYRIKPQERRDFPASARCRGPT